MHNILLARNLPFDCDVRQSSHPLMIPLHCVWAISDNRTRGSFGQGVEKYWTQLDKRGWGLQNWTIFVDVICVSYLSIYLESTQCGFGVSM